VQKKPMNIKIVMLSERATKRSYCMISFIQISKCECRLRYREGKCFENNSGNGNRRRKAEEELITEA
jgi:hypothetical protein